MEWIQSPTGTVNLPDDVHCKTRDIFTARLDNLRSQLNHKSAGNSLVIALCGEIGNNSFDHNTQGWRDVPGVLFSPNIAKRQIVLADRGQGIFKTISRVKPSVQNDRDALHVAFTEVISGRSPERRGNGLKFVRTTVSDTGMALVFQSGDAVCTIHHGKVEFAQAPDRINGCLAILNYQGMDKT